MNALEKVFAKKKTENGDLSYNTTGNKMLDILFMTSYFEKHLAEVHIGNSDREKLFSMFIRDPRNGLGRRDLGRRLLGLSEVDAEDIEYCGRFDDLLLTGTDNVELLYSYVDYMYKRAVEGNELAKKWFPRLNSTNRELAKALCEYLKISEQDYRKLIKVETTEKKLTEHRTNEIRFEQVPSLAMIKYFARFAKGKDTRVRFEKYLESVKKGEKKLNISTTNVYDIYRNRNTIDVDLFFDKLEKIKINCLPILDTSGSMWDSNDSIGKAISIAHYLSKCSTYCNGQLISFSSNPQLITIKEKKRFSSYVSGSFGDSNKYSRELNSMYTGDCSNTDFGKVMKLLEGLEELPEYLVVLSDMEFDIGSNQSKKELQKLWKEKGYTTKIVWWNFAKNRTVPETDEMENIYISGYSPMMLKYLQAGFDGERFLNTLLDEYYKKYEENHG